LLVAGHLVLVVDDDPSIRETLALAMEIKGCRVATARNGVEALQAVDREQPAIVLLDMQMPVLDGPGFMAELVRRGMRLPVVLMSSDPFGEQHAREFGAVAYLSKPFGLRRLLEAVDLWTGSLNT
jgi:CheY-like chemotaxis protein